MKFVFNGIHSDTLVKAGKTLRPLLPELEKNTIKIPGRDGELDLGNESYTNKIIEQEIFLVERTFSERILKARQVAAWLSKKGELAFDDDPDIHYIGRIYNSIGLETFATAGYAKLIFDCSPFGLHDVVTEAVVSQNNQNITVVNNGGVETPMRIKLKNTGTTTINQITLMKFRT